MTDERETATGEEPTAAKDHEASISVANRQLEMLERRLKEIGGSATLVVSKNKHPKKTGWRTIPAGHKEPGGAYLLTGEQSGGVFVVDCDSTEAIEWFMKTFDPPATFTVATKRGCHFYFQSPGFEVKNKAKHLGHHEVDVRGRGGGVEAPGSPDKVVVDDLPIAQAPKKLLEHPDFPADAVAEGETREVPHSDIPREQRIANAKKMLETEPVAISGQGGHNVTIKAAGKAVRLHLLNEEDALDAVADWNAKNQPPWSERDLRHKIQNAIDHSPIPWQTPEVIARARAGADRLIAKGAALSADGLPAAAPGKLSTLTFEQVCQALYNHPDWDGKLRFNVLTRQSVVIDPPVPMRMARGEFSEGDEGRICLWFAEKGFQVAPEKIKRAVSTVVEMPERSYNPIVDYLDGLPSVNLTKPLLLDTLHEAVLNSPDGPMASRIMKRQLVAAVRRARAVPGLHDDERPVEHRTLVVLYGPQESGKSQFLQQLAGPHYAVVKGDIDEDHRVALRGNLIVELEEMRVQRKTDLDELKAFISTMIDTTDRAKYGRRAERVQRSYVLFGTTDKPLALDDQAGNTRFVVIHVGKMCGEEKFLAMRDQIWAEANELALAGFDNHLDAEEKAWAKASLEEHEAEDTTAEQLREALAGIPFVTTLEAYRLIWQGDAKKTMPRDEENRFSRALLRIGCQRAKGAGVRTGRGEEKKKGWIVPPEIADRQKVPSIESWLREDQAATRVRERILQKVKLPGS